MFRQNKVSFHFDMPIILTVIVVHTLKLTLKHSPITNLDFEKQKNMLTKRWSWSHFHLFSSRASTIRERCIFYKWGALKRKY